MLNFTHHCRLLTRTLVITAGLGGCASSVDKPFNNVTVLDTANQSGELCGAFRLNDAQAEQFLNRTRAISAKEMSDHYNFLPCYVEGRVTMFGEVGQLCHFRIDAGGIAELSCDDGGRYIYVCDTCEHLLSGGETGVAVGR